MKMPKLPNLKKILLGEESKVGRSRMMIVLGASGILQKILLKFFLLVFLSICICPFEKFLC
ncbi:hypothetical protein Fmac_025295 [Flemingia macrophylla]|uniref:Uncharacterized protein n=1 Tax=Flemingia macrophylla TaxID=520843 RepID=A0ABD1LRU1_9FABA